MVLRTFTDQHLFYQFWEGPRSVFPGSHSATSLCLVLSSQWQTLSLTVLVSYLVAVTDFSDKVTLRMERLIVYGHSSSWQWALEQLVTPHLQLGSRER